MLTLHMDTYGKFLVGQPCYVLLVKPASKQMRLTKSPPPHQRQHQASPPPALQTASLAHAWPIGMTQATHRKTKVAANQTGCQKKSCKIQLNLTPTRNSGHRRWSQKAFQFCDARVVARQASFARMEVADMCDHIFFWNAKIAKQSTTKIQQKQNLWKLKWI